MSVVNYWELDVKYCKVDITTQYSNAAVTLHLTQKYFVRDIYS